MTSLVRPKFRGRKHGTYIHRVPRHINIVYINRLYIQLVSFVWAKLSYCSVQFYTKITCKYTLLKVPSKVMTVFRYLGIHALETHSIFKANSTDVKFTVFVKLRPDRREDFLN